MASNRVAVCAWIMLVPAIWAHAADSTRVAEIAVWMSNGTYSPTPTIEDRSFWSRIGALPSSKAAAAEAEKLLGSKFEPLPDELFLEYSRNGNRTNYQDVFFAKLDALRALVVAECVENRGRFLGSVQDLVTSYAADKTWVLPAHDGNLDNFHGRQITIDLFSSEVACDLATADHLLGNRINAETKELIRREVTRRIFEPYKASVTAAKPSLGWLTTTNNWNAVCLANVTGSALALHDAAQDKAIYIAAAEKYIQYFLRGFTDDGYCSEGVGYWNYGYGCFVRLDHMIRGATQSKLNLADLPKSRNAGLFARRVEITPGVYPAFADCPVGATPSTDIMSYVSHRYGLPPSRRELKIEFEPRWLDEIGLYAPPVGPAEKAAESEMPGKRDWFEDAGIMICRGASTPTGVSVGVALKGGHNNEHHNHNDVGSFVFCVGDTAVLVDPGAEVYTRRTFSRDRYVSNLLNSFGHPVPKVAGQLQKTGRAAAAKVLDLQLTDNRDELKFDLSSAYPVESLQRLTRTFTFQRSAAQLDVLDEVEFHAAETFETALVTFSDWKQTAPDQIVVGEGSHAVNVNIETDGTPFRITATTIEEDIRGEKRPKRIGVELADRVKKGSIRLTIAPAPSK